MPASALDDLLSQLLWEYRARRGAGRQSFADYVVERTWQDVMGEPAPSVAQGGVDKVKDFVTEATRQAGVRPPADMLSLLGELTGAGTVMGSPPYMAPDQARADHDRIGPATDVYALGAVLYHLLTGRAPFQGTDLWQVLTQVQAEPPPPIGPGVNQELAAICLQCLEKRIDRRYATAAALAEALQRFLDGPAAPAAGSGPGQVRSSGCAEPMPPGLPDTRVDATPRSQGGPGTTKT
jgi:serine/threonine protein kinase